MFNLIIQSAYKNGSQKDLINFVTSSTPTKNGGALVDGDFLSFIYDMMFSSLDPDLDDPWMNFDEVELEEILKDPFFDEYNDWSYSHIYEKLYDTEKYKKLSKKTSFINKIKKYNSPPEISLYKRKYPYLDVYSYIHLQAYATTVLPKSYLWDVNVFWTYHDLIEQIYKIGFYDSIATIYKSYGIHWFTNGAENDPIKYKWACYAVAACKKAGIIDNKQLRRDLSDIYKELLIAAAVRNTIEENQKIITYVNDCITNFDNDQIDTLIENIKTLKNENNQLLNENKQLTTGINILRSQMKELQHDGNRSDDDIIEEMVHRIYNLSPQNESLDKDSMDFKEIWSRLDRSTKKDIKLSISMFHQFKSFDMALFPMIRSLEHEFARNFFVPFHMSKLYANAGMPICTKKKYEKTHDSLLKNGSIYPTMGNIPFIGRAMSDVNAQNASNIIKAFRIFLGENRIVFTKICKSLDNYRIGTNKYKLVDIRNGIAHGDIELTDTIDKKCYEETSKLLYEPPLQILFEVIRHSMKNKP